MHVYISERAGTGWLTLDSIPDITVIIEYPPEKKLIEKFKKLCTRLTYESQSLVTCRKASIRDSTQM
jgi:hypothetical protein